MSWDRRKGKEAKLGVRVVDRSSDVAGRIKKKYSIGRGGKKDQTVRSGGAAGWRGTAGLNPKVWSTSEPKLQALSV